MLKTLNLERNVTAILENAYGIGYEKTNNEIWTASFSLPLDDPKVNKVQALKYVEITHDKDYIGLFRVIPKQTVKNENQKSVTFQLEHVLATLIGSTLFKYHQLTNKSTIEVIDYLLAQQKVKHWKRGKVEIVRYFHYSWENENVASGIFSVPKPFDEPYRWTFDTTSYPWTLNLIKPETEPACRIKEKHNLLGIEIEENPLSVFNRIYPLGYGEGVNQLGIESVNGGVPYIEDAESIAENGLFETVWVDRRFEDAASLMANGKALLKKWKEPVVTWKTSAADVSKITGAKLDELKEGKVVRVEVEGFPVTDLRIMKESRRDIKGDPGNVQLEIGNLVEDLSTTQADLERRQKVNETYAQGATNIDSHNYVDNCDQDHPAVIRFYLPADLVNVNTMTLSYETEPFRAYSQATQGGGSTVKSTSSGGGTTATSSSGGGVAKSTSSGGGTTQSSTSGGGTTVSSSAVSFNGVTLRSGVPIGGELAPYDQHEHLVLIDEGQLGHSHSVSIPAHNHSVTIPSHSHEFNVPNHSHNLTIPNHSHEITLPDHTHEIKHGIFELSSTPSKVTVKVDGTTVLGDSPSGNDIDLIPYLSKDDSGRVERGAWHEVTLTPNGLGRINANIISRLFISSQIGGTF
ncbi:hypothetical protein FZC78_19105 [Rossellomorea vietnamensis]|uniref:Tail spike domain-containing protein n=1 Tax=Rossellomorea vietnamensis TaxID=218284 RepID=A0A5D4NLK0_9BACI|nr:phage tail protein [Rossellomorea vietnamensis]TYS14266.1 hypothetical protein FZC78_19105 [Rossellomorea vietnamensis]